MRKREDLKVLGGEVKYELDALCFSYDEMLARAQKKDFPFDSLFQEVFLLHFRSLLDFLQNRGFRRDTVLASHYVDDWEPSDPDALRDLRTRVNQALAHISDERLRYRSTGGLRPEELQKMRNHITEQWTAFNRRLSVEQKAWFVNPLAHKFLRRYA